MQQARDEQSRSRHYDRGQWELYRLSVVEEWPESPYKAAVIGAIKHKLMILALQEKASDDLPDTPTSTENTT